MPRIMTPGTVRMPRRGAPRNAADRPATQSAGESAIMVVDASRPRRLRITEDFRAMTALRSERPPPVSRVLLQTD